MSCLKFVQNTLFLNPEEHGVLSSSTTAILRNQIPPGQYRHRFYECDNVDCGHKVKQIYNYQKGSYPPLK